MRTCSRTLRRRGGDGAPFLWCSEESCLSWWRFVSSVLEYDSTWFLVLSEVKLSFAFPFMYWSGDEVFTWLFFSTNPQWSKLTKLSIYYHNFKNYKNYIFGKLVKIIKTTYKTCKNYLLYLKKNNNFQLPVVWCLSDHSLIPWK